MGKIKNFYIVKTLKMKNKSRKKIWLFMMIICVYSLSFPFMAIAADDDEMEIDGFNILPTLKDKDIDEVDEAIDEIWATWWQVMDTYRDKADQFSLSQQMASWIMNRNTIMNYLVFVIKFLSQLWLTVWTGFIIFAGYKYMISLWNSTQTSNQTIKNAIIWIVIVIFSYAIMKSLTSIVWLS